MQIGGRRWGMEGLELSNFENKGAEQPQE